jgi:hypothetical protein
MTSSVGISRMGWTSAHPPGPLLRRRSTLARPIWSQDVTVVGLGEASLETGTLSDPVTLMSCGHPHSPLAQPVEEADRDKIR